MPSGSGDTQIGSCAACRKVVARLDHAVWFHGRFRADEWLYYDQEGTWADGGRAICQGRMFDRSGQLVVTVMQEGMLRRRR